MLLEEKLVVTKQDTASKETFFSTDLMFQSNIGLKISHQKMKNVTWGVRNVPKKCHVLFEWPLNHPNEPFTKKPYQRSFL